MVRTVEEVERTLGPLDTVLHSAGIALPGRVLEQPTTDLERVLAVNYLGTVHVARATVPRMISRGRGEFVVFASLGGWLPAPGTGAYSASKAAVLSFCEVLAAESRHSGVRIVCACPAPVETPMLEQLRRSPHGFTGLMRGSDPRKVVVAARTRRPHAGVFVFPTTGARAAWRARRLTPGLLSLLTQALLKRHQADAAPPP